jgi:hypothetical protein
MKREYRCDTGELFFSRANRPIIFISANGTRTYLWIGNDENERASNFCFATLSGRATLRLLANSILAATKPKKKKRRAKP